MDWLNYHHLLYFWTVAREGTIAKACAKLGLAQPTISGQIRALERALKEKLFVKEGRRLALTDTGRLVHDYAEQIFGLGNELLTTLRGRPPRRPIRLVVGVGEVLPQLVVYRLLEPIVHLPEPLQITCVEGKTERLAADLAVHELDVVLSDAPLPPGLKVKAYNHLLGECGVSLLGSAGLVQRWRGAFPNGLNRVPLLLPPVETALRRALDGWFDEHKAVPQVRCEFADTALIYVFGQAGVGFFAAPSVLEKELRRQYDVRVLGRIHNIRERFHAITVERRIKHPALVALTQEARSSLFAQQGLA